MSVFSRPDSVDPACNLVSGPAYGTGYHTRFAAGTPVHPLRESIGYAVDLLAAGQSTAAQAVIAAVLAHQDTDPYAATFGIWPWFAEEPLTAMAPPDWNWADFIGAQLAEILVRFPDRIESALHGRIVAALANAGWSIFRRNMHPGYTNIALMGAAVAAVAGEACGEPRLLAYARRRLEVFLSYTEDVGGFNEYNSPTYTIVALEEIERILRLVRDPAMRATADRLHRIAWTIIAEHWHPATGEWAGPCSRAYHDRVQPGLAAIIGHKIGRLPTTEVPASWAILGPPCPPELAPRFAALPQVPYEIVRRFAKGQPDICGTTWMDGLACLGTVNRGTTWTQARAVLGYWHMAGSPAAVLRVRQLKDGRDFASGVVWSAQSGPRALVSLGLATDQGDWHCSLDRPAEGAFTVNDLRLRISLQATGAAITRSASGWTLSAGAGNAKLLPLAGCRFDGAIAAWEPGADTDHAWLDLVLHHGGERRMHPASLGPVVAACGIALDDPGISEPPTSTDGSGRLVVTWSGLRVEHRSHAGPAFA